MLALCGDLHRECKSSSKGLYIGGAPATSLVLRLQLQILLIWLVSCLT